MLCPFIALIMDWFILISTNFALTLSSSFVASLISFESSESTKSDKFSRAASIDYGAIVSAGTFTHGHVGPNVLDELLRVARPDALFIFTVHFKLFKKAGFDKKLIEIKKNITQPTFHEVDVYGSNPDKEHGSDQVIITVFRKK